MRRKDAVRMVELGGHGATLTLFALQLEFQAVAGQFQGCYIAGQVFFTRSRSPPTPSGPGGSGNTNGARY